MGLPDHGGPRPARDRNGLRQRPAAGVELSRRDRKARVEVHREERRAAGHGARGRPQPGEVEQRIVAHRHHLRPLPVAELDGGVSSRLEDLAHLAGAERQHGRAAHAAPNRLAQEVEGRQHVLGPGGDAQL